MPAVQREPALVMALALATAGALTVGLLGAPPETVIEARIIDDSSGSVVRTRVADELLDLVRGLEGAADRFEVEVVALSDKRSGFLPRHVARVAGRRPGLRLEAEVVSERTWEAPLRAGLAAVTPTDHTAIFGAIDATLRALRGRQCERLDVRCVVIVRTDGLEEEDRAIVARLRGRGVGEAVAPRLDNADVEIVFCGLAERAGTRTLFRPPPSLGRVELVWASEFTVPANLTFRPSCRDAHFH